MQFSAASDPSNLFVGDSRTNQRRESIRAVESVANLISFLPQKPYVRTPSSGNVHDSDYANVILPSESAAARARIGALRPPAALPPPLFLSGSAAHRKCRHGSAPHGS